MKTKTLIIAGFPGIGKSYAVNSMRKQGLKVSDSDSSSFSWIMKDGEKVRNPNFVHDYMEHIREKVKEGYNYVFVSTHEEIIKALNDADDLNFIVVKPHKSRKDEFKEIYEKRGDVFKDFIINNWDDLLDKLDWVGGRYHVIVLKHPNMLSCLYSGGFKPLYDKGFTLVSGSLKGSTGAMIWEM